MSHYAKLAALAFRFLGIGILFYSLPMLLMMPVAFRSMPPMGRDMPLLAFAGFLFPILAVIVILAARPLGELVARGIE